MKSPVKILTSFLMVSLACTLYPAGAQVEFEHVSGRTLSDWQQEGEGQWIVEKNTAEADLRGNP